MADNALAATTPTVANGSSSIEGSTQKRISRRDSDESEGEDDCKNLTLEPISSKFTGSQTKRFKRIVNSAAHDDTVVSPTKTLFTRVSTFSCIDHSSPITEISKNLSDTKLESPAADGDRSTASDSNETPRKGWRNAIGGGSGDNNQHLRKTWLSNAQDMDNVAETLLEETLSHQLVDESSAVKSNFQMASRNGSGAAARSARRLNMDGTLHEMAVDELSFYADDDDTNATPPRNQTRCFADNGDSPSSMAMLLAEGSPLRFQIMDKSAVKFLQPTARSTALGCTATVAQSNCTPPKNFRMFHSLSSGSMESSMDDEYMELFEMESLEQQLNAQQQQDHLNFPSDLNSLISGQIKHPSPVVAAAMATTTTRTPDMMRRPSVRRCLSMTENMHNSHPYPHHHHQQQQPKTPETATTTIAAGSCTTPFSSRLNAGSNNTTPASSTAANSDTPTFAPTANSYSFKRPEPPSTTCSPVLTKRYRGEEKENIAAAPAHASLSRPPLRKSMSMNDAQILTALARCDNTNEPVLIGDFSKPFVLPLMEGRHRDLKSVSSETVARLLRGEFKDQVGSYSIIDCRYPYEFEGGHIRGAKNLYTQEQIIEEFLTQNKTEQQLAGANVAGAQRNIVIFHCEFSSERGPKLSRFLRNNDRERNTNAYPSLDYPEVYLLHNGYKEFYETYREHCDPIAYRPMLEPAYSEAYRHFRAKAKSWNGDSMGGGTSRVKKSRSRLML